MKAMGCVLSLMTEMTSDPQACGVHSVDTPGQGMTPAPVGCRAIADFVMLLRPAHNLKCMNYLFLNIQLIFSDPCGSWGTGTMGSKMVDKAVEGGRL